jgi:acetyl esterase
MTQELPVLDHTIRELIDELAAEKGTPVYKLSPDEARHTLLRAQSIPVQKPEAQITDSNIDSTAGPVRVRTIRPLRAIGRTPVIVYFHGGGWVLGDATTHDRLTRELAAGTGATVVFVEYGRAPEHRYPVAIEQAYAATRYVSDHPDEFDVDSTRLCVAGDSAGGNMAAVVSLLAKERSGPRIDGQLLFYPVTNANFETASYKQFADGPWLTRPAMEWFWDEYLPDQSKRKEPNASPLLASLEQLAGLPRALVITAENDVLRDEGEAYGRKLMEAGVEVVVTRYNGAIHDFMLLNRIANSAPVRAALTQAVDFLKLALS